MIDKLMKSNPKNYTLPLVREGISTFIMGIKSLEDIEKLCGIALHSENEEKEGDHRHEDFLAQAKNMLIKGPGGEESSEQRLAFEQTIAKYMELARLSN